MRMKIILIILMALISFSFVALNELDNRMVSQEAMGDIIANANDSVIIVEENAGILDTFLAQQLKKDTNIPLIRVEDDELSDSLTLQSRKTLYIYGNFDDYTLKELEEGGFIIIKK